jgi:hypothetical protein
MKNKGRAAPSAPSGAPFTAALDVEDTIGPDASRTHIRFPFEVDGTGGGLEILFSYEPKVLADAERTREMYDEGTRVYAGSLPPGVVREPLNNLLTLSLDGPSGFRGCAHRHNPLQRIVVDPREATPGFIPGAVEAGRWTATVSVHAVVTDRCTFRLQVRPL